MGGKGKRWGETNSSVGALEHVNLALGSGPSLSGDDGLQDLSVDVPELVVLSVEEEDGAGGLRVEGGGDVLDDLGDDLAEAGVGDGRLLLEGVDGAAGREGGEVGCGRHFGCGGGGGVEAGVGGSEG
jgi:hypothetical protein